MKTNALGFIGGGRITGIFLQAFSNKSRDFEKVVVYDTNPDVITALKEQFPYIETDDLILSSSQPVVFIALHPPVIMETLEKIGNHIHEEAQVVSLAPKITIEMIASKLRTKNIARMIPNATSYINEGFNPIAFSPNYSIYEKADLLGMLSNLGHTFEVKESLLEAYAMISAMLPTYFWFQWKELIDLGSQMGLTPHESSEAIAKTVEASLRLMFKSDLSAPEVMDLIPVKPLGDHEAEIREMYQKKLIGLFGKIKP